jgi:dolichol kinase
MCVGLAFILSLLTYDRSRWFFLGVLGLGLCISLLMEKKDVPILTWFLARYDKTTDVVPGQGPITFFTGTLISWFIFGGDIAIIGVIALAFGDPTAYVFGKSLEGPRLPWNKRKTIAGSIAFMISPILIISLIWGPIPGIVAGVVGSIAESLPFPNKLLSDDNIIIPIAVSIAIWILTLVDPGIL